jgi:hypothetical protein
MFCPKCGHETGNTKFCIQCGAPLSVNPPPPFDYGPGLTVSQQPMANAGTIKRRSPAKTVLIVLISIILLAGASAVYFVSRAADSDTYNIGKDTIPSIKAVVGKRDVGEVSASTEDGVIKNVYSYKNVKDPRGDLNKYISYLRNNKYILTKDMDLNKASGTTQLGTESSEKGKIILMDIEWATDNYEITIQSGEGTLNRY